jgi:hypothetical protein
LSWSQVRIFVQLDCKSTTSKRNAINPTKSSSFVVKPAISVLGSAGVTVGTGDVADDASGVLEISGVMLTIGVIVTVGVIVGVTVGVGLLVGVTVGVDVLINNGINSLEGIFKNSTGLVVGVGVFVGQGHSHQLQSADTGVDKIPKTITATIPIKRENNCFILAPV